MLRRKLSPRLPASITSTFPFRFDAMTAPALPEPTEMRRKVHREIKISIEIGNFRALTDNVVVALVLREVAVEKPIIIKEHYQVEIK